MRNIRQQAFAILTHSVFNNGGKRGSYTTLWHIAGPGGVPTTFEYPPDEELEMIVASLVTEGGWIPTIRYEDKLGRVYVWLVRPVQSSLTIKETTKERKRK